MATDHLISRGRHYEETYSAGTTQAWIRIDTVDTPTLVATDTVTVGLVISSGSGSIEYTAESTASVIAGTASGKAWPKGTISATDYAYFPSTVTAVRAVRASGSIKLVVAT